MTEENYSNYFNHQNEFDEELNIDLKKLFYALWNRKKLILKVFLITLIFFASLTYILPKKYVVSTDLYINKTNNSNMTEINPYVIEEVGNGMAAAISGNKGNLDNEIELIKSSKVINNVIKDNNIKVKKLFGIIKTKKYGQYVKAEKFVKKVNIENKKGTNVVSISYKSKDRELAYNVVTSIMKNAEQLHAELNTEKSLKDIQVLQTEYNNAKAELKKKLNSASGAPQTAISGSGNILAMSAFSKSAQHAMNRIHGAYKEGTKSQIAIQEESAKVTQLATKLEWAKLVQNMSDSSKVIVIREPEHLKEYEQVSPKLFMQIVLGIIFGILFSLISVIYREIADKKLTYSMLGEKIIYNLDNEFINLQALLLDNEDKNIAYLCFDFNESTKVASSKLEDATILKATISKDFKTKMNDYDAFILLESINQTDSITYKLVKEIIINSKKTILAEILI